MTIPATFRDNENVTRHWVILATIATLLLTPLAALGTEPSEPIGEPVETAEGSETSQARPVIGLVLSGGAAGGLAHVGVIQWFEEHHVPIDLVAGTSSGGLVAGLYATGASAGEMSDVISSIDWQLVFAGDTPYEHKSLRRKEDARQTPTMMEFGLRDGVKLPLGLDAGHQVGLMIDRIAFPYSELHSFDHLPTPFACVAVDLESGDEVVFRAGRLAEALRATMSFPGWFAPVHSGDRVLVDGGVLNNLPTDVMTEMGADIIIAVDLGLPSSEGMPIDDILGVLNRTVVVMMRHNTDRNAELADLVIAPDVSGLNVTDFSDVEGIARLGYEATIELAEELGRYSLDDSEWQEYLQGRADQRRAFEATPEFLEISGATEADEPTIEAKLNRHLGVPLDPDGLDFDLTSITGWGRYDVVGYGSGQREGTEGLDIDVHEKTNGPPFMRTLLDMRGSEFREALVTFGARFTFFDLAGSNSEWRIDASYGETTMASTQLFMRLGRQGFFVAPRAIALEQRRYEYVDGERVAEYTLDRMGGGGDVGYVFGPRSELRVGADLEYQRSRPKIGDPSLPTVEGTAGTVSGQWIFDGANSPLIPTRGVALQASASWIFATPDEVGDSAQRPIAFDDDFYQAMLYSMVARPLGGRFSLFGSAEGGTSFNATASPQQQFQMGGPFRLGALRVGELRGSHYYLGRAGVLWALAPEAQASPLGKFYLTAFYEIGDAFEGKSSPYQDITLGLTGETLLGGVFVGGAVGEEGRHGFFFAVGRLF